MIGDSHLEINTGVGGAAACTIISKNYLPYARVLADSFARHHPDIPFFVLLADRVDGYFDPDREAFKVVNIEQIAVPDLPRFCFQYTILELNTAAKPYFLEYLLQKYRLKKLIYFDPDILILNDVSGLFDLLEKRSIVLTPHVTSPIEDDGHAPTEKDILRAGTYNLGFIALASTPTTQQLLAWWKDRVYSQCLVAFEQGLFVDQKWIDLIPGFFEDLYILRDPGYNVAYWNLNSRKIIIEGSEILASGSPCYFFHFSSFDPENIKSVSRNQNRFTIDSVGQARILFNRYSDLLLDHGYKVTKDWPYAFARFDNGVQITEPIRRIYLQLGDGAQRFGNPFISASPGSFYSWLNESVDGKTDPSLVITHFWYEIYKRRPDLRQAFPDIFGSDRRAFAQWAATGGVRDYALDERFVAPRPVDSGVKLNGAPGSFSRFYHRLTAPYEIRVKRLLKRALGENESALQRMIMFHRRLKGANEPRSLANQVRFINRPASNRNSGKRERPFGVNLAGYIASEKGVGEALRSQVRNLEAVGIPYVLNDFRDSGSLNKDLTYTGFSADNPYGINLIQVNADQVPFFARSMGGDYFEDRYNIGFWNWELPEFPPEWMSSFQYFDEVWVASRFALDCVSRVAPIPVVRIPFSMPEDLAIKNVGRSYFDLPDGKFIFLFIFDYHSFPARKNPVGLVTAFKKAFSRSDDAILVLKCSHSSPEERERLSQIIGEANVRIIDEVLDRDEVNTLLHLCDCYVSLHRSEGFGLTMAEAMRLGKPVIATSYSGNMDFMTAANSLLVKYKLVGIDSDHGPYRKGYTWAEPDLDHAAELMRSLFENNNLAKDMGREAQQDILRLLHPKVVGALMKERLLNSTLLNFGE